MSATTNNNSSLPILKWMGSILDGMTKIAYNLSGLAMFSMLTLIINEVVMRYFFNAPTSWSSDVNQWLFALTVMLALPEITRVNGNVAITIILEKLSENKKNISSRALAIISFIACLLAVYISGIETFRQVSNDITTTWVNPIPKWWISVVIPFGFLLSSLQFLRLGLKPSHPTEE